MNHLLKQTNHISVFVAIILICSLPAMAQQIVSSPTPLSSEEQQLINSRRANEEAQAEYYREQTKKLREPPAPAPTKSFWQSVAENPASILGVVGAILAALFAASVGLLTLYVNNRASLRVQRDTQFYEAMKRFGDKDSPLLRASAAGILSQMASIEIREFDILHPIISFKTKNRPYLVTARNQLVGGLVFEESSTTILFLRSAIIQTVNIDPFGTGVMLFNTNRVLQEYLRGEIAKFLISIGAENPDSIKDELWNELSHVPVYDVTTLKALASHNSERFVGTFKRRLIEFKGLNTEERQKALRDYTKDLNVTAYSLYMNVDILSYALRTYPVNQCISKNPVFLVNGDLKGANLTVANLQNSLLMGAQMQGALLFGAKLQGAKLNNANITGSILYGSQIDADTDMQNVNWWEADFSIPDNKTVDLRLLELLYQRYSASILLNLDELHPSVRDFISGKRAKA